MGKLSDPSEESLAILLWGPPKSGKSVLASQFPGLEYICLEKGLMSVRGLMAKAGGLKDFPLYMVDEAETTDPDFLAFCPKHGKSNAWTKAKALFKAICDKAGPDKTIVLDNLSRASEYLLAHIRKLNGREKLEIQDWMTFTNEMMNLMDPLKSTKARVILIAHEQYDKDEVQGDIVKSIFMPSKTKHRIPSLVSDFLYLSHDIRGPKVAPKIKRILQTVPNSMVPAGSRCLIPNIEDPTYEKIRPYLAVALGADPGEATWTPVSENA